MPRSRTFSFGKGRSYGHQGELQGGPRLLPSFHLSLSRLFCAFPFFLRHFFSSSPRPRRSSPLRARCFKGAPELLVPREPPHQGGPLRGLHAADRVAGAVLQLPVEDHLCQALHCIQVSAVGEHHVASVEIRRCEEAAPGTFTDHEIVLVVALGGNPEMFSNAPPSNFVPESRYYCYPCSGSL